MIYQFSDDGTEDIADQPTVPLPRPNQGRPAELYCPGCGEQLVFFAADRLFYCRPCGEEYTLEEVER